MLNKRNRIYFWAWVYASLFALIEDWGIHVVSVARGHENGFYLFINSIIMTLLAYVYIFRRIWVIENEW